MCRIADSSGEHMKSGKICLNWKGKVVGQISPIKEDVFLPFVPFIDSQPKGEKFIFAKLQNKFDLEMIKTLNENGIRWICFPID